MIKLPKNFNKKEVKKEKIELESSTDSPREATGVKLNLAKALNSSAAQEDAPLKVLSPDEIEFPEEFYQVPDFDAERFESNMKSVAEEMLTSDPDIKTYLRDIVRNLKKFGQVPHMLSDEQIGLVVTSFQRIKNREIKASKPRPKANASVQKVLNKHIDDVLDVNNW